MYVNLSESLVIGISSRALFDLEEADQVFQEHGEHAYIAYQKSHENEVLKPGVGFRLVQAILALNQRSSSPTRLAEVVVASRNSPATSLRLFHSIAHYGLDIQRAILTSGTPVTGYLPAFSVDLYLSAHENDVQEANRAGIAAAVIYQPPQTGKQGDREPENDQQPRSSLPEIVDPCDELRIAFDGDNVLFGSEAQDVYDRDGLDRFLEHEVENAGRPLADGPFAKFLRSLAAIQKNPGFEKSPIRTALVTARNLPAHLRVLNTFRAWNIQVDEAFFMGGASKLGVLEAFHPHIYFDDQKAHCDQASKVVSTAIVPVAGQER